MRSCVEEVWSWQAGFNCFTPYKWNRCLIVKKNHKYEVLEKYLSLHLNVIENVTGKKLTTLSAVLKAYFDIENIEEPCNYFDIENVEESCNGKRRLQRKLVSWPDVLVIQLKRFNTVQVSDQIVIQKEGH